MTRHKIYVYASDLWACGHYRLVWPGEANADHDVEVVRPGDRSFFGGMVDKLGRLRKAVVPPDAAAVVVQRPTYGLVAQAVPLVREQGVAVIVDMDDDLASIHPANPAWLMMHPNQGDPNHSWHAAQQACRDATLVTCSTEALVKRYAPHGRGLTIHNHVPKQFLEVEHQDNEVITWCSSLHSHPNDPAALGPALANVLRQGAKFQVVGSGIGVDRAFGLGVDGLLPPTGTIEFEHWPGAVASSGITIAPLADTRFNAAKSWLKPLEAMAAGVPVVMSPRVEYQRLHDETGVGFLCEKPKQWEAVLRKLLRDPALRREQSEAGRAVVKERFVLEDQAWQWAEAWQWAIDYERGRVGNLR